MVTRRQAAAWAGLALVLGLSTIFYMLIQVSPLLPDGTLNAPAVVLFVLCLTVLIFGMASLAALWLHRRWPVLAGARSQKSARKAADAPPPAAVALRQGGLLALAVATLAVLAILQELDVAFIFVAFGVAGLVEAYIQSRATPSA
jgi:hypothetical protein